MCVVIVSPRRVPLPHHAPPPTNWQTAFVTNLNATLTTIFVRCPTCFVAVAGPALLGEGPLFPPRNVGPLYYWGKQRMLDKYRSLTRELCAASFVPYIDVRQVYVFWLVSL